MVVMTKIILYTGSVIFFSSIVLAALALLWKEGYWPFPYKGKNYIIAVPVALFSSNFTNCFRELVLKGHGTQLSHDSNSYRYTCRIMHPIPIC